MSRRFASWWDVATATQNDDPWEDPTLYAFLCDDVQIGFIQPHVWAVLQRYAHAFVMDERRMTFGPACTSVDARTDAINALAVQLRDHGEFPEALGGWRHEQYAVYGRDKSQRTYMAFTLERAACALFGFATFGVHLTAYTPDGRVWVPKRSATKATWPGMYDNSVAGGITAGENVLDTIVRECEEEASLDPELVTAHIRAVGVISYFYKTPTHGYRQPEMQYVRRTTDHRFLYDLCLPSNNVRLQPNDQEAQSFELMDRDTIWQLIVAGAFKPNCALGTCTDALTPVLLDFFIRHGWLTPEKEPDYTKLVALLHTPLRVPTP